MPSGTRYLRAAAEISLSQIPVEPMASEVDIATAAIVRLVTRIAEGRCLIIARPIILAAGAAGIVFALARGFALPFAETLAIAALAAIVCCCFRFRRGAE